ncbi:MAG: hypothetical protein IJ597_01340, partial [Synergistaceae bacterium]|nr:hypothetical protein [Synergistaceae bacterium]
MAKCFNTARLSPSRTGGSRFFLLFSFLFFAYVLANPAYALSVRGIPEWLEPAVVRSLNAVWSEIPKEAGIDREGTLVLVASRLFAGYDVEVKSGTDTVVFFRPNEKIILPEVKLNSPELRGIALDWFYADIKNLENEISDLIKNLPQSALTWADEAFREEIKKIIDFHLPGWDFSQQIFISQNSTLVNLTFRPSAKMILAVKPSLYSYTIPVMFLSDLEAKLIPAFSPLIGVPVAWAEKHKLEIENLIREFLEERHSVENLRAAVNINFTPNTVSNLEAQVDSKNFMFQMWISAYAGLEGRYPEFGAFFGFRPDWKLKPEFYAEFILDLNDFNLTHRWGGRVELLENLWAGIENQWPDNNYFFRLQYSPIKIRRPFALWRYSPELDFHEAALGYKIDEHMSIEFYYYTGGSKNEKFGLR